MVGFRTMEHETAGVEGKIVLLVTREFWRRHTDILY